MTLLLVHSRDLQPDILVDRQGNTIKASNMVRAKGKPSNMVKDSP